MLGFAKTVKIPAQLLPVGDDADVDLLTLASDNADALINFATKPICKNAADFHVVARVNAFMKLLHVSEDFEQSFHQYRSYNPRAARRTVLGKGPEVLSGTTNRSSVQFAFNRRVQIL